MKQFILLGMILLMLIATQAQEFKNLQAKNAMEKYKSEIKKAEEIKEAAEVKLKKDLTEALASAMKMGDLDEANKIKAVLDGKSEGKEEAKAEPEKAKEKPKVETKLQKANRLAIVGTWKINLQTVVFKEDNTFKDETRDISGTWEFIDDVGNFKMKWSHVETPILCPKPIEGKFKDYNGTEFVKQKDKK